MSNSVLIAHPSADLYGSDRVMLETVEALTSRGNQVVVTLPATGPLVAEIRARGAVVRICPSPVLRKSALRPLGILRLLRESLRSVWPSVRLIRQIQPDVVFVNTITIPLWLMLAKALRLPSICHVHEAEGSLSPLVRRGLTLPLLFADRLVANSKFSVGVLASAFDKLGRRTTVVYNAVASPPLVRPARAELAGQCRLLYLGRLSPRKGPQVALQAVERLAELGIDAHLDVTGAVFPGYEWFERELRESVARGDLDERVSFHGYQADVWPYLADADIVVVPSIVDEPFGNTAVEAVLAGRPLVVSATGGLLEAAEGYASAQHVSPGRPELLAAAIATVVGSWSKYRDQAAADRSIARERHRPELYREQIAAIVSGVA